MRITWLKRIFGLTMALALAFGGLAVSGNAALAAPTLQDDDPEEVEFTGTVLSFDADEGTLQVGVEDDDGSTTYTVLAPEDFDFDGLSEGDTVEVEGTLNEDGEVVATKVKIEDADDEDEEDEEDGDKEESFFCANLDESHPFAQSLADSYDVSYEQVMAWFCEDELGFGLIMLALQAEDLTGESADDLLSRFLAGEGWGVILQDLGVIGRPEDAGPPGERGRPEWVGAPENPGPPEWAGPPDETGRPDDVGPPHRED